MQTDDDSSFECASHEMLANQVKLLLPDVIGNTERHKSFLNLLSFLEHLGCRKIIISQAGKLDQGTLRHIAEESRHALLFKRAADRLSSRGSEELVPANTLAYLAGRRYFNCIDSRIRKIIGRKEHPQAVYLAVSFIVELRAVWFYKLYRRALEAADFDLSLGSLIAEETKHLKEMDNRLEALGALTESQFDDLVSFEHQVFRRLIQAIFRHA